MAKDSETGALPTLKRTFITDELDESIACLSVSPDGLLIAVGTLDDDIIVYDANEGTIRISLDGHIGGTNSLAFVGGSEKLASAGEDGTLKIWHTGTGDEVHTLTCDGVDVDKNPSGWTVTNVAVDHTATRVACSAGKTVHLFTLDVPDPEDVACVFPAVDGGVVTAIRFTRNTNIAFSFYGGISIAPLEPDTQATTMPLKTSVDCLDSSPTDDWFVGGCQDQTLHIWHLLYSEELDGYDCQEMACGGYTHKVNVCNWQPGKESLLLASAGGNTCTVWNFIKSPAGSMPTLAIGHQTPITCQAWKPDGTNWMVTGSKTGSVAIHNLDKTFTQPGTPPLCEPVAMSPGPGDPVVSCAWTPQDTIIVAFQRGIIMGYKFEAGKLVPLVEELGAVAEEDEEQSEPAKEAAPAKA